MLAGGAAIGAVYSDADDVGMLVVGAAVALLFVFAALVIRLVIWTAVKSSYPGRWFYDKREGALMVTVFVLLLAAAIPAYRDYRVRQSVEASLAGTAPVRRLIENHFAGQRSFPPSIDTEALHYDRKSGSLTLALEGGSVVLTPSPTGFGALAWTCRSADLPARHLPASCR